MEKKRTQGEGGGGDGEKKKNYVSRKTKKVRDSAYTGAHRVSGSGEGAISTKRGQEKRRRKKQRLLTSCNPSGKSTCQTLETARLHVIKKVGLAGQHYGGKIEANVWELGSAGRAPQGALSRGGGKFGEMAKIGSH